MANKQNPRDDFKILYGVSADSLSKKLSESEYFIRLLSLDDTQPLEIHRIPIKGTYTQVRYRATFPAFLFSDKEEALYHITRKLNSAGFLLHYSGVVYRKKKDQFDIYFDLYTSQLATILNKPVLETTTSRIDLTKVENDIAARLNDPGRALDFIMDSLEEIHQRWEKADDWLIKMIRDSEHHALTMIMASAVGAGIINTEQMARFEQVHKQHSGLTFTEACERAKARREGKE